MPGGGDSYTIGTGRLIRKFSVPKTFFDPSRSPLHVVNRLNGGIVFNEKGFVVILGESDTTTSPSAFRGDFVGGNLNSKASLLVWLVRAEEVTCLLHFCQSPACME